ncbi:MAG: hypothetical protein AAGF23_14985 [Acidobacteriota bacterium]
MSSLRPIFTLVRAQVSYSRWGVASALAVCTTAGLAASLVAPDARNLSKAWGMNLLLCGILLTLFLWVRDIQERRTLFWLQMPIKPSVMAFSRLALPAAAHGLLLIPFVAFLPLWLGQPDMDSTRVFHKALGMHAFSLGVAFFVQLSEEVTVLIRGWGTYAILGVHLLFAIAVVVFASFGGHLGLPEIDSTAGIVTIYAVSAATAAVTARLYLRRSNYLVGVDACTSMPVDWSRAAD